MSLRSTADDHGAVDASLAPVKPVARGAKRLRRLRAALVWGAVFCGVAVATIWMLSERELARTYAVPESALSLDLPHVSSDLLARGRHLATVVAQCQFCHGSDLGGREVADDFWIGRMDASNLTRGEGGVAQTFATEDWVRAIRFGVRRDGRSLLLMPSRHLAHISDTDLGAVIAFLQSVPPIDRPARAPRFGPVARFGIAIGSVEDIFSARTLAPESTHRALARREAPTAEYGAYLVELGNCRVCHKADLSGGLHPLALPSEPEPPSLVGQGALAEWTYSDFARAMRTGQSPTGRALDREFMPWPAFAGLTDLEIEALWRYLRSDCVDETCS